MEHGEGSETQDRRQLAASSGQQAEAKADPWSLVRCGESIELRRWRLEERFARGWRQVVEVLELRN